MLWRLRQEDVEFKASWAAVMNALDVVRLGTLHQGLHKAAIEVVSGARVRQDAPGRLPSFLGACGCWLHLVIDGCVDLWPSSQLAAGVALAAATWTPWCEQLGWT